MDREKLVKELLFHIRLGEDSSIEFKAVRFEGNRPVGPNKDSFCSRDCCFC